MIMPLTHERTTVRRMPWVSFTIIGLCLLAFFATSKGRSNEADSSPELGAALEYYLDHPYLTLDRRLVPAAGQAMLRDQVEARQAYGRSSQSLQQQKLDALTRAWLDKVEPNPLWRNGLIPSDIRSSSIFTHMFLHAGLLHLLGNLFFFYLLGPFVEDVWGRAWFSGFYLLAGIFSGLAFAASYADLYRPLIGASGAIAGVMGAFLVLHGRTRISFFYWLGIFVGTFRAPAWLMLPLWFCGELASAILMDRLAPGGMLGGVAYWAHVWGFVFGVGATLLARRFKIGMDDAVDMESLAPVLALEEAQITERNGFPEDARQTLSEELRRDPNNQAAAVALWELALRHGWAGSMVPLGQRLVRKKLDEGQTAKAVTWWRELRRAAPQANDALISARLSEAALGLGWQEDARDLLRDAIEAMKPDTAPGFLLKLVRYAREVDKHLHQDLVEKGFQHPGMTPEQRQELDDQYWRLT